MSCPNCDWLKKATDSSGEKIEKSGIFFSLLTKGYKESPLCALQLGIAILLGKPIAIIALEGEPIPSHLRRLSFAVEECEDAEGLEAATKRVIIEAKRLGI